MEVSEVLKEAWAAVTDAELPEKIQEVAFREAVRLLNPVPSAAVAVPRAGNANGKGGETAGGSGGKDSSGEGKINVSEDEMYANVVAQTGVNRDKLEQVVHLDDDGPRISLAGLKLGKNLSERARAAAQILTITRGFGIGENETSLEVIRAECERLKVYDSPNFSSQMRAITGYVINGTGQNRRLRAKSPGIAAFPGLVDSLLGGS